MKKILFILTLFLTISNRAEIQIQAPPAIYADSWSAFNDSGDLITRGSFEADSRSASTGYKYASVPNDTARIEISSIQKMYLNRNSNDITKTFSITEPFNDSIYTLSKKSGSIVVELKPALITATQEDNLDNNGYDEDNDYYEEDEERGYDD